MAAVKEKPDTLHSILDRFVVAQRKDIKEFSGGHLNESKMLQQRHDAKHKPWRSANVNKSISVPAQLSGKQKCGERNVTMTDTIMNFSLGTTGNIPQPQNLKVSPGPRSKRPLNVSRASTEDSDCSYTKHDDGVLVEEIKPLGLQKSPRKLGNAADIKESDEDLLCRDRSIVRLKYDFLPSHMDAVTKADRFVKMREYENDILKKHDTTEQNVLSGTKAVIHLESKLKKVKYILIASWAKTQNILSFTFHIKYCTIWYRIKMETRKRITFYSLKQELCLLIILFLIIHFI